MKTPAATGGVIAHPRTRSIEFDLSFGQAKIENTARELAAVIAAVGAAKPAAIAFTILVADSCATT